MEEADEIEGTGGAIESSVSNTVAKLMQEGVLRSNSFKSNASKKEKKVEPTPEPDPEEPDIDDDASAAYELDSIASSLSGSRGSQGEGDDKGIYYVHSDEDDEDDEYYTER